jgi:aspartate-semialdehyde dehydrogenase
MPNPTKSYTVAILGATGLVGGKIIEILQERAFPITELRPLASERSLGSSIMFNQKAWPVQLAEQQAFEGVDIVLASAGAMVSQSLVPCAVKQGAIVIDNTSFYRMHADVPLVVAGVNDADLAGHKGIIANPNCSTAQLMPVLKSLHALGGLKRIVVSTYQSVSGAGKKGLDELRASTQAHLNSTVHTPCTFQRPIGFNLIPHIDQFLSDPDDPIWGEACGYTKEEAKLIVETRKILHLPQLAISATAVRVPVQVGHSESVAIEFERPVSPQSAIDALRHTPDVVVAEATNDYHTPLEGQDTDPVYVSRIRPDLAAPAGMGLCLWVVSDNLRIGAALNAVRLAESLINLGLV